MTRTKQDFSGGIQTQFEPDKSNWESSYSFLSNARVRSGSVVPVRSPREDLSIPAGTHNGLYAFDRYLILFAGGKAYARTATVTTWTQIPGFLMDSAAPIYVEAVPASYVNFSRNSAGTINFASPISQTPSALVCMNGVNQPWAIFPDGTARKLNSWADWAPNNSEYVPIAKYPVFFNGKLYCVMADRNGKFNQIVDSVSGRPFDFVKLLTDVGTKAGTLEAEYGAIALAYSVTYEDMTGLKRLTGAPALLGTVARASYIIQPNEERLIVGEPTYSNIAMPIGAVTNDAITDLNGDTALVSQSGLRTFNGVSQLRWEGKNSPLIRKINKILGESKQDTAATVQFDNYVGFAMRTARGNGILWWDDTLNEFVALDKYSGVNEIVQFAVINVPGTSALYFRTSDDRVFEAFAGEFEQVTLRLHDLAHGEAMGSVALNEVAAQFEVSSEAGYWTANAYADGQFVAGDTQPLSADTINQPNAGMRMLDIGTSNSARVAIELAWRGGAKLSRVDAEVTLDSGKHVEPLSVVTHDKFEEVFIMVGNDGLVNANRTANHTAMLSERGVTSFVGLGNHAYTDGSFDMFMSNWAPYWAHTHRAGRFIAAPGHAEMNTDIGSPFFQTVRQYPTRFSSVLFSHTEFFLFDSGFTTAGAQVNPDNSDGVTLATSTQASLLQTKLRLSSARNKIVCIHHAAYTSSGNPAPHAAAMQALYQLAVDAGATAIVNAGANLYERIVRDVPHLTVGTGGAVLHSIGTVDEYSQKRIAQYGYLRVRCSPLRAVFEFVSGGSVLDRFVA
jgi:hypothetical protein